MAAVVAGARDSSRRRRLYKERWMFTRNTGYRTVADRSDEFLDVALIADERGGSMVIFNPKVVQKRREHFRDQGSLRIGNMLVCVIPGWIYVIVVVHAVIVDGEEYCAKWEHVAENRIRSTAQYKSSFRKICVGKTCCREEGKHVRGRGPIVFVSSFSVATPGRRRLTLLLPAAALPT
jgi:hypothetical protein